MRSTRSVGLRALAIAAAAVALAPAAPASARVRNLAPNPGFERSVFEPSPVPYGTQPQPLLPVGWVFEGATVLFDHTPNARHSGKRGIAISGSLAPAPKVCDPTLPSPCVSNPTYNAVGPTLERQRGTYSVRPVWRTEKPIRVRAGTAYTLSYWAAMPTLDASKLPRREGAASWIRWVNRNGDVIRVSPGPTMVADGSRAVWRNPSRSIRAPRGATGAYILLGHTNVTAFTQVAFDDVKFYVTPVRR